ncbi:MAG: hypothetical protein L6Q55_05660 [Azonexus sp.]|nr:hypothetical protein [Azonexus sp.]MCK6411900.1 hypothetical protein [Azonexus sp.]
MRFPAASAKGGTLPFALQFGQHRPDHDLAPRHRGLAGGTVGNEPAFRPQSRAKKLQQVCEK